MHNIFESLGIEVVEEEVVVVVVVVGVVIECPDTIIDVSQGEMN